MPEDGGSIIINPEAIAPIYEPWEEPNRIRAGGETSVGRIESRAPLVGALRPKVREWRAFNYPGVSDTTRHLLQHWFGGEYRKGDAPLFRYYYCQQEAVETLIYLHEFRESRLLPEILANEADDDIAALGLKPDEWRWPKFAFKMATGSGKTKCMSLAIAWSYFHALRESHSQMPMSFVVIAPNLTVFERLRTDFRPESGPSIFETDPLIPPEWRGDWDLPVVLQDESGGGAGRGALFLTNIHRLHPKPDADEPERIGGPRIVKAKALANARALRDRIAAHGRIMIVNDEAHHVWDPGAAWNTALQTLHNLSGGIAAQLDFSATPKDNSGRLFQHIVCDYPLGEAVNAGIVKTPIVGRTDKLEDTLSDNAAERYHSRLQVGYQRWLKSRDEWKKSGRNPLMFVMCENTDAADDIAKALNMSPEFLELNGRVVNLHTNLKGEIKTVGKGRDQRQIFVESEKEISDENMRELRRISRELDSPDCQYSCVVSVLMLREGWDVKNVTTIVPLRPLTGQAKILPEQTLGRGLRRMTPSGKNQANEVVVVVDHPAFADLYNAELTAEGMDILSVAVDQIPQTTVTIYPDSKKGRKTLDIAVPKLSSAYRRHKMKGLSFDEVRAAFQHKPLDLGKYRKTELQYEGRQLFTNELVEAMKIHIPLLKNGFAALTFFVDELQRVCGIRDAHAILAPLVRRFLCEILFGESLSLNNPRLVSRLADGDVREHVRATFVPLIRTRTVEEAQQQVSSSPTLLGDWRPYQATSSERSPALPAKKSIFNLTPCRLSLEVAMTQLLDRAPDVAAFAKNAGPQAVRIDYLAADSRVASYTPDFIVRDSEGKCFLVETKGQVDVDVPRKAAAACAWCSAASEQPETKWEYVYAPQKVVEQFSGNHFGELKGACGPALESLMKDSEARPELPFYDGTVRGEEAENFYPLEVWAALDEEQRKAAAESLGLLRYCQKQKADLSPAFILVMKPLERRAKRAITAALAPLVPEDSRDDWFSLSDAFMLEGRTQKFYETLGGQLRHALLYGNFISPIGMLMRCLECALKRKERVGGVFAAVREKFRFSGARVLLARVQEINKFRNSQVSHDGKLLEDSKRAEEILRDCVKLLADLSALESEDELRK